MNEELKNKLTERFNKITAGECDNKDLRDALLKTYIAGGEYGYNYAVEKACEWLEQHAYLYVDDIDQLHESALIGDFRKCMED